LSLLWDFGHSVLYLDHARNLSYVIWTRFHCSLGDVLILLGSFWWTSLWFRTRFWFAGDWRFPAVVFALSGLAYTAWSEWYNTRIAHTWAYAPTMPRFSASVSARWLSGWWFLRGSYSCSGDEHRIIYECDCALVGAHVALSPNEPSLWREKNKVQ
jgi:hypothetical protein